MMQHDAGLFGFGVMELTEEIPTLFGVTLDDADEDGFIGKKKGKA